MHEQSETIERDGKWYNVYGRGTPQAGQDLPGERPYDTVQEAVAAAGARSRAMPDLMQPAVDRAGIGTRIAAEEQRSKELKAREQQFMERWQGAQENEEGVVLRKSEEMRPLLERAAAQRAPEIELQQEKVPNFQRPTMDPKELQESFGMLMAASLLVGAASRQPFYNTMNAMTGAMNGFLKQDAAIVDEKLKEFDKNLAAIKERNQVKRSEYDAVWDKYKNNLSELKRNIELVAVKYDDELALAQIRSKGLGAAVQFVGKQIADTDKAIDRMYNAREAIESRKVQWAQVNAQREATREAAAARQTETERHNREMEAAAQERAKKSGSISREELSLMKEYEKSVKPYQRTLDQLDEVDALLSENSAHSVIAAGRIMQRVMGGSERLKMDAVQARNFGDLSTRIGGSIERFLEGKWSEDQIKQVKDSTRVLRESVIAPSIEREKERWRELAVRKELNPDNVVVVVGSPTPEKPNQVYPGKVPTRFLGFEKPAAPAAPGAPAAPPAPFPGP